MKTIYTIPAPDSLGAMIEVYGEPENAWYEWRIIDGGRTVRDTGTEGHSAFQGVVCGRGRNPTLRLWPAIFSGEIDVFPSERRNMGQEIGR